MKVSLFLISILFELPISIFCQQDPEAKKILEDFSSKSKSYSAYSALFTVVSENHQTSEKSETKGSILIKKTKYKIEINDVEIYFDGKDVYNYTKKSNEVSIAKSEKAKDDFFLNNPTKIFSIYSKEYKFQYLGDIRVNGRECYEVDLYPFDIKKKYSIIKLIIDKEKLELVSAQTKMKSGVDYTVKIEKFVSNATASDNDFIFDIKAHKNVEVVDLR